ncbi:MAG TPA: hypothetical protein VF625_04375 [Longimicrobium sp.]
MNPLKPPEPEIIPRVAAIRRWSSGEARRWAESAFVQLCGSPNVMAVVLFGSSIRPAAESFDFDCLYIYHGERPDLPQPPMDVDIRAYQAADVERLIESGHDLFVWSIRMGELVCEREGFWTRLRESWLSRLPALSPETADDRAAQAERMLADLREMGDEDAAVEQWVTAATHRARAALLRAGVFPASRPELPAQLREIGSHILADALIAAMAKRKALAHEDIGRRDVA